MNIPVEVSAHHIHLSQKDLDTLFGKNYQLTKKKSLSQKGEFAAEEVVQLVSSNYRGCNLRVLGPVREHSQIELSMTDAIRFEISAPVRVSGDHRGAPKVKIIGPKGETEIPAIVAQRHLHCSNKEAKKLGLKVGQTVKVEIKSDRGLTFDEIVVRTAEDYKLSCHLDTDEANACGLGKVCGTGTLITNSH